jgi:hypothetical protein
VWCASALVLAAVAAAVEPVHAQERTRRQGAISGRVISTEGDALAGADVWIDDSDLATLTDDRGEFRLNEVPGGMHLLRVARIGYAERADSVTVTDGDLIVVSVRLSTEPIELEPLVATVQSLVLERAGFYGRQEQGFGGRFVDRITIERKNPGVVTDLFRNMPGIRVQYGGIYGSQVFVNQSHSLMDGRPGCLPSIWLDGIRSTMRTFDMMRVEEIEGIEVYAGGGPGKFNDLCGTILVWTKVRVRR